MTISSFIDDGMIVFDKPLPHAGLPTPNQYNSTQRQQIVDALTAFYSTSKGKELLDSYFATYSKPLSFTFISEGAGVVPPQNGVPSGEVVFDPAFSSNFVYINRDGVVVQEQVKGTVAHELVHALTGLDDEPSWYGTEDYAGDTVTLANEIFLELGLDEQLSYPGSTYLPVSDHLEVGRDYTPGDTTIHRAWSQGEYWPNPAQAADDDLNDLIIGQHGQSELSGGGGDDVIYGNRGNDILSGEDGNDYLFGEDDDDQLIGGNGSDILVGGHGDDTFLENLELQTGPEGNEPINPETGEPYEAFDPSQLEDVIDGGEDFDTLDYGGMGLNVRAGQIYGEDALAISGPGATDIAFNIERLIGSETEHDVIDFSANYGALSFDANTSTITYGGKSLEILNFDEVIGSRDGDTLNGNAEINFLDGAGGNDTLNGGGDGQLLGGDGNDILNGAEGDRLSGGAGNDTLTSGGGNVFLSGGSGTDTIHAQIGDTVTGDINDTLYLDGVHITGNGFLYSSAQDYRNDASVDDTLFGKAFAILITPAAIQPFLPVIDQSSFSQVKLS